MTHRCAVVALLLMAVTATASVAQANRGGSSTSVQSGPATDQSSEKRKGWVIGLRTGKDARTVYASMLESPDAGGLYFASELEALCASVSLRDAPSTRTQHQQDPNAAGYGQYLKHLDRLRTTCASMQPAEASFARSGSRHFNSSERERDPMLTLRARLLAPAAAFERRKAIGSLLEIGPPANLGLFDEAMMWSPGQATYFLFDGTRYAARSTGPATLDKAPEQLLAALDLAACDLGMPCGGDSIAAARTCMQYFPGCGEPDFPSMVRAQLRMRGYSDFDSGWKGIERLRTRLGEAVLGKDLQAFTRGAD